MVAPEEFAMLIKQAGIGERLYAGHTQYPLARFTPQYRQWERYARHRMSRWGFMRRTDHTAAEIFERRDGNFASRLASYTAQLEYNGEKLFAIQTGMYSEGDYHWSGVTIPNEAYSIRSIGDYNAAYDYFLSEDDPNMWDSDWCYNITYVVAPASIIKAAKS